MFEDQLTGITVFREVETGSYGDDDTATTKTEVAVFSGLRLIDPIQGQDASSIINIYGTQTAQMYRVYFDLDDPIRKSDIVKFNGENINHNIEYSPSTDDVVLRITNFVETNGMVGSREADCIAN
jgi:hypothetical protein